MLCDTAQSVELPLPGVELSVIVVTYNSAGSIEPCLSSIQRDLPAGTSQLFVVDNASTDGTAAVVRERFPHATLIANEQNRGFGAANNQALAGARGRYVTLVNPDCVLESGSLAGFARFLDAHPRAAVAGGRLHFANGAFQHSAFRFPSLGQIFLDFFPLHWRLAESRLNGRYPRQRDAEAFEVDHPLGALMCVRRAAIAQVGQFDERFFMYAEEVDWCWRFKQAGWEVWHCPQARAIHLGGQSTQQRAAAMFVELHRSRRRFYRKHYSPWFQVAARALVWLGAGKQALQAWMAARRDPGAAAPHRERLRACLDVMRL